MAIGGAARGFIIGGVVAAAGAATAALLLVSSGKADEVNLTSANLVPADASIYIGINTDLKSSQWVNAFAVAKKLGSEDPEGDLMDSAEMADLDWEEDVVPFLGGDAAIFYSSADLGVDDLDFEGGVILKAKDPAKAIKVLRREITETGDVTLDKRSYAGVDYEADSDDEGFLARIGDHIVVTTTEATMKAVIDASKGGASLGADQGFRDLRDDLTRSFIAFSYVNPTRLTDSAIFSDEETRKVLERAGAGNVATSPFGGVFTASKGAFRLEQASKSTGDGVGTWAQPRASKLVDLVPANAAFFVSTTGVPGWWQQYSASTRRDLEDAFGEQDVFDTGELFQNVDDVVAVLSGEVAGALWFDDGDVDGVFLAEVGDEKKALDLFVKLLRDDDPRARVSKKTVNGVDVTVVGNSGVAVSKGVLYLGSSAGIQTALDPKGSLTGSGSLARSAQALGAPLGSFLFVDIGALVSSGGAEDAFGFFAPPDALEAFILNIVNSGGFARFGAAVTVKE